MLIDISDCKTLRYARQFEVECQEREKGERAEKERVQLTSDDPLLTCVE